MSPFAGLANDPGEEIVRETPANWEKKIIHAVEAMEAERAAKVRRSAHVLWLQMLVNAQTPQETFTARIEREIAAALALCHWRT